MLCPEHLQGWLRHPENCHILLVYGRVCKYVWPGGYPVFYLTGEDKMLCAGCVQDNLNLCSGPHLHWRIKSHNVNWNEPHCYCDDCGVRIESVYAEEE